MGLAWFSSSFFPHVVDLLFWQKTIALGFASQLLPALGFLCRLRYLDTTALDVDVNPLYVRVASRPSGPVASILFCCSLERVVNERFYRCFSQWNNEFMCPKYHYFTRFMTCVVDCQQRWCSSVDHAMVEMGGVGGCCHKGVNNSGSVP